MCPIVHGHEPMAFILEPICIHGTVVSKRPFGQFVPMIHFRDFSAWNDAAAEPCMPVNAKVLIPFVLVCHKLKRPSGAVAHSSWRRRYINCIIALCGPLGDCRPSAGDVTPVCMARCLGSEQYMCVALSACEASEYLPICRTHRDTPDRCMLHRLRPDWYEGNCWES